MTLKNRIMTGYMKYTLYRLTLLLVLFSYLIYGLHYNKTLWVLALFIYLLTEYRLARNQKTIQMVTIKVFNSSDNKLPARATELSAGVDVICNIAEPITLQPLERALIPTGLFMQLPEGGYELQVRPRSGLALKHGITLANCVGTIDGDYRGEVGVIAINLSNEAYTFQPQEKIAQFVLAKYEVFSWESVPTKESLEPTERGEGGFGSSGY